MNRNTPEQLLESVLLCPVDFYMAKASLLLPKTVENIVPIVATADW